jgi:hypothetical protein
MWKGPLLPARRSPPRTIGDVLLPAMQAAGAVKGTASSLAPKLPRRHSKSNSRALQMSGGPKGDGPSKRRSGFDQLRRKLASRVAIASTHLHAASTVVDRRSYAQVVMAGGSTARYARGGAVAAEDRPRSTNFRQLTSRARGAGRHRGAEQGRGRGRGRGREGAGRGAGTQDGRRGRRDETAGAGSSDVHAAVRGSVSQEVANGKQKGTELDQPAAKKKRVLRCSICSGEHFTSSCPQLHGHKPAATFCGLAREGLGFFHIPTDGMTPAVMPERESATALITITRGEVSPQLLKSELIRILLVE